MKVPSEYKPIEECRPKIEKYIKQLDAGTDDADPEQRDQQSTARYIQDLKWYDHWLDEQEIQKTTDVTSEVSNQVGVRLSVEFNGTTPLNRWNRIFKFHDWVRRMGYSDENPFEKWDDVKDERFGLTRSTEQARRLDDDQRYATSEDEVRQMEENVGRHRTRNQLVIRLLWQTGIRRGEAAGILLDDLDRDAREITIRKEVAKNDEERVVAYQRSLDGLLDEWLKYGKRAEMAAGKDHGHLFVGERGAPLSGDRINDIVIDSAKNADINEKLYADANAATDEDGNPIPNRWKISAHALRHGYGTYMVNQTDAGLWEVSNLMGHSSVKITENIYVEDDVRAGIEHGHKFGPE